MGAAGRFGCAETHGRSPWRRPVFPHFSRDTLFWWLEKNKDLSTKQLVEELYALICNRISDPITYQELKNRKMGLDTKGIIPVQV